MDFSPILTHFANQQCQSHKLPLPIRQNVSLQNAYTNTAGVKYLQQYSGIYIRADRRCNNALNHEFQDVCLLSQSINQIINSFIDYNHWQIVTKDLCPYPDQCAR